MKAVVLQKYTNLTQEEVDEKFKTQFAILREGGFELSFFFTQGHTDEEIIEHTRDADVIMGFGNPTISRKVIEGSPKLKAIQSGGIGVNGFDRKACSDNGVLVMNNAGYCVEELAVHAAGMILSLMRDLPSYDRGVRSGNWPKGKGKQPLRISNLTMGIVGLGGSGRKSANIWHNGFGCKVIAYDPYVTQNVASEYGVTMVDFKTLCSASDLITIHCPLTDETFHMFNRDAFSLMKPNVIIANTARGPIIEQSALLEALEKKTIKAAGLDVFETEPVPADNPLLGFPENTFFSPHSAYKGKEANRFQAKLTGWLPVYLMRDKTIYSHYVTNPEVLDKFADFVIHDEILSALDC